MSVSHLFSVAIFSALVSAQDNTKEVAKETTEEISKYDNLCFHCIDMDNLFCADDATAKTGKCYAAVCAEESLTGEEKKAAKGQCTLKNHACYEGIPMIHYSQCMPSYERNAEKCPEQILITQDEINSGGRLY